MPKRKEERFEFRLHATVRDRLDCLADKLNMPRARAIEFAINRVCEDLGIDEGVPVTTQNERPRNLDGRADTIAAAVRMGNGSDTSKRTHVTLKKGERAALTFMCTTFGVSKSAAIRRCIFGSAINAGYKPKNE